MYNLTRITLAHNKISLVPPALANLNNLEILNLFNNEISELPTSLSSMPKLRILNIGYFLFLIFLITILFTPWSYKSSNTVFFNISSLILFQ